MPEQTTNALPPVVDRPTWLDSSDIARLHGRAEA